MHERRERTEVVKIPVEHCTAIVGNGHYIVFGAYVGFDSLKSELAKIAETSQGRVKPLPVISKSWSARNPCTFCRVFLSEKEGRENIAPN